MATVLLKWTTWICVIITVLINSTAARVIYTASVIGLDKFPEIKRSVSSLSQLLNPDSDFEPNSESILRDVLQEDMLRMKAYLESYGFYDAHLFPEIEALSKNSYKIVFHIEPGDRYTINHIKVLVNGKDFQIDTAILSAKKDTPIINEQVLKDKHAIGLFLKKTGYAFVEILDEAVEINHSTLLANITYAFKTGAKGTFGHHKIAGLKTIDSSYIEKFIQWTVGDIYNIEHIYKTEELLMETGLFESVLISAADPLESSDFIITINLEEAKQQHLQFNVYANASLSSDSTNRYEIGIIPRYIHDNIAGANEKFEINTILSNIVQDLNIIVKKPHFVLFNTNVRAFFSGERRAYDSYLRLGVDGGVGVDYRLTKNTALDVSIVYDRYSLDPEVMDADKKQYNFIGIPIKIRADTRDNKIFSTSGLQAEVSWAPYFGGEQPFHQLSLRGTAYIPLQENFIIACWGRWDTLQGIDFHESPMDRRIYLGGSQNLRGYNKDSLGELVPLKKNPESKVPIGGLSAIAFGIEPRFQVYKKLWGAVFCAAGELSKTANVFKDISKVSDLYWDGGASLFYFTDFGPLRVDVAYPFGGTKENTEKEFKFYISFGQAF